MEPLGNMGAHPRLAEPEIARYPYRAPGHPALCPELPQTQGSHVRQRMPPTRSGDGQGYRRTLEAGDRQDDFVIGLTVLDRSFLVVGAQLVPISPDPVDE